MKQYKAWELLPEEKVYLKSEADKVIAEKDAEIARLKAIRKVHIEAIESMGAGLLQDAEEIRHQKYKRCLDKAKWCESNNISLYSVVENNLWKYTSNYWLRWRNKWLELAEKLKEAK